MNYKELKPLLPTKWEDIKLKDYLKICDAIITLDDDIDEFEYQLQMVDNVFSIVSKLTGISLNELFSIEVGDISKVVSDMSFIFFDVAPNPVPHLQFKKDIDVSYGNYITFSNLTMDEKNISKSLPIILQSFLVNVTEDEVLDMNIVDVMGVFFCHHRSLKEYLKRTRISLLWTIVKQRWMQIKSTILSMITKTK